MTLDWLITFISCQSTDSLRLRWFYFHCFLLMNATITSNQLEGDLGSADINKYHKMDQVNNFRVPLNWCSVDFLSTVKNSWWPAVNRPVCCLMKHDCSVYGLAAEPPTSLSTDGMLLLLFTDSVSLFTAVVLFMDSHECLNDRGSCSVIGSVSRSTQNLQMFLVFSGDPEWKPEKLSTIFLDNIH